MSRVFWTTAWSQNISDTLWAKISALWDAAGFSEMIAPGRLVAIKAPLGGIGSHYYLRPLVIRAITEKVIAAGGQPVITDTTNTLWNRENPSFSWHEEVAVKGYSANSCGAPLVIANGYAGEDGMLVPTTGSGLGGIEVAQAIYEADAIIVVTHVTGHPLAGISGAVTGLGSECLTSSGRRRLHEGIKPIFEDELCNHCGLCIANCPWGALISNETGPRLLPDCCTGCIRCLAYCPQRAITVGDSHKRLFQRRVAEAATAVQRTARGKIGIFSFLVDITPQPDCYPSSGPPLVVDIGFLASRDPVAADSASVSLIQAAQGFPRDSLPIKEGVEKFALATGADPWFLLDVAEGLGLGKKDYELLEVPEGGKGNA